MIREDFHHKIECYYGETPPSLAGLRVLLSDGSMAMILYRLCGFLQMPVLGCLGSAFAFLNKLFNGCVIGRHASFGKGFVLMHPVGVVINGAVRGGENIVIESGVVIGAAGNGLPVRVPRLGNNIFIGAGAKILGDIHIGDDVIVGANAVVVKDVPANVTAVGIPAQYIPK